MLPTIYSVFPSGDANGDGSLITVSDSAATTIHTAPSTADIDHVELRIVNAGSTEAVVTIGVNSIDYDMAIPASEGLVFIGDFDLTNGASLTALGASSSVLYASALVRRELEYVEPV